MSEEQMNGLEPGKQEKTAPQAGAAEIAVAVFIFLIMIAGVFWSYSQGYETGYYSGRVDLIEDQDMAAGANRRHRAQEAEAGRRFYVEAREGRTVKVVVENEGQEPEERPIPLETGESMFVYVEKTDKEVR